MNRTAWRVALIAWFALAPIPLAARVVFNTIGANGSLIGHGHVVQGTVLIACTEGERVQVTLTLTQASASGTGSAAGICTGELAEYDVTVPAGSDTFVPGLAAACATADNYHRGVLVDSKQWCRAAGVLLE